jgi:hypothetical protein
MTLNNEITLNNEQKSVLNASSPTGQRAWLAISEFQNITLLFITELYSSGFFLFLVKQPRKQHIRSPLLVDENGRLYSRYFQGCHTSA